MSEPFQYDIFSAKALEDLAERISSLLPKDIFVTVMYTEHGYETDIFTYGPSTGNMPSIAVARNEKRIDDVFEQIEPHPPWDFDTEKYPVMLFSIESYKNYYGIVGITLSREVEDFDDYRIIYLARDYIRMHIPDAYVDDDDEFVDVVYFYGSITNPKLCYEEDDSDDY